MSRAEASTVSITSVDLTPTQIVMRYHTVEDQFDHRQAHVPLAAHTLKLDREPSHNAAAAPITPPITSPSPAHT